MRIPRLMPLIFAFVLATAASVTHAQPAPPPAPAKPLRIAIVNPSRVFKDMAETKSLSEALDARTKDLHAQELQKRTEIETMMKQRADYNPSNHEYRDLSEKIDMKKADLQAWGAASKASLDRDQKFMVKGLYDKIEAAIAVVAQRNGIDLVLPDNRRDIGNLEEISSEELQRMLALRTPLYADKNLDISELVIAELDKKFTADKK